MKSLIVAWLAAGIVFLALDMLWLGRMTGLFYRPLLGGLVAAKPNIPAAFAFYVVYVTGIVIFAIVPALARGDVMHAALLGACLGLFGYGAYDLTNQATLRSWHVHVTLVDMAWGVFLTAASAGLGALAALKIHW
jgi:uncharacterized membrane protein